MNRACCVHFSRLNYYSFTEVAAEGVAVKQERTRTFRGTLTLCSNVYPTDTRHPCYELIDYGWCTMHYSISEYIAATCTVRICICITTHVLHCITILLCINIYNCMYYSNQNMHTYILDTTMYSNIIYMYIYHTYVSTQKSMSGSVIIHCECVMHKLIMINFHEPKINI